MTDLPIYKVSDSRDTITTNPKDNTEEGNHFLGDEDQPKVRIFDVPGLGNGPGAVDQHGMELTDDTIVDKIKEYNEKTLMQNDARLSAIIWVETAEKWQKDYTDEYKGNKKVMESYVKQFQMPVYKNVVVVFNKDHIDDKQTEEQMDRTLNEMGDHFRKDLKAAVEKAYSRVPEQMLKDIQSIPCVHLDLESIGEKLCDQKQLRDDQKQNPSAFNLIQGRNKNQLLKLIDIMENNSKQRKVLAAKDIYTARKVSGAQWL